MNQDVGALNLTREEVAANDAMLKELSAQVDDMYRLQEQLDTLEGVEQDTSAQGTAQEMRKTREIEEEIDRKLAAIIDGVQTLSRSVALPPKLAQLLEALPEQVEATRALAEAEDRAVQEASRQVRTGGSDAGPGGERAGGPGHVYGFEGAAAGSSAGGVGVDAGEVRGEVGWGVAAGDGGEGGFDELFGRDRWQAYKDEIRREWEARDGEGGGATRWLEEDEGDDSGEEDGEEGVGEAAEAGEAGETGGDAQHARGWTYLERYMAGEAAGAPDELQQRRSLFLDACGWLSRNFREHLAQSAAGQVILAGTMPAPRTAAEFAAFADLVAEVQRNATIIHQDLRRVPAANAQVGAAGVSQGLVCTAANLTELDPAEAAEVDPEALEGVDDFGFDAQGNFYPLKGMPEERFDAFLDTVSRQGAEYWVDKMARNAAELHDTGVLREDAWKLEWLDEYGYLVPEALEPGSEFLREHPHILREWVLDSPAPIKWRGDSLNESQVEDIGAVREWDVVHNSDPDTWGNIGNETTLLLHTGMGAVLELRHHSVGPFQFSPARGEQVYYCHLDLQMGRSGGWSDGGELLEFADMNADCFEHKMKTTHMVMGHWRGMVRGPRVVVWNVKAPDGEIHLLEDGFIMLGTAGRSIQVRVEPLLADRHKMYFGTTATMLSQLRLYYNSTTHYHTGARRLPLWTYAPGTDCYERQGFFKVLRHEAAPNYLLDWMSASDYAFGKRLYDRAGVSQHVPYDRNALVAERAADRARAAAMREAEGDPPLPRPSRDHVRGPVPTYNAEMGVRLTEGKGHFGQHGRWVDPPVFRYPPRYRLPVIGVDNEREEQMHRQRLQELRFQRAMQARMRLASCPPEHWHWQLSHNYSQFDLQGIPTHDAAGSALSPAAREELEDRYEEHAAEHAWFLEQVRRDPQVMVRRGDLILDLQRRINAYDPFSLTVDPEDESTRDLSYMKNKPLGPFTIDPAELAASKDWDPEDRAALLARRVLPFER